MLVTRMHCGGRLQSRCTGALRVRDLSTSAAASDDELSSGSAPSASTMDEQIDVVETLDIGSSMFSGWQEGLVGWAKEAYPLW
eukprot:CAMPEP_0206146592 /NCGR_PEP_ID=MMETSP1473-20131121/30827_1 /ASSEMBLY_ACC=CAM_ASM_001109 /TAXON_ID=1461547 /ORGANISM="Stichococcus sp, Strain RCC1054" /LENGTH=82 /DNA_ID=CAMNT_0053543197 /DNA_START=137 /DNA_END=382 /DNA_ORIENTATION=+